jgi:hypothetical protein
MPVPALWDLTRVFPSLDLEEDWVTPGLPEKAMATWPGNSKTDIGHV